VRSTGEKAEELKPIADWLEKAQVHLSHRRYPG
jgi:hypothetical protein